ESEEWVPSHLLSGPEVTRGACGACGAAIAIEGDQDIVPCPACGAPAKVERRMRSVSPPPELADGEDPRTLALLAKLRAAPDLAERVALAKESFDSWSCVNDTMAGHLGELLELIESGDPRFAHAAGGVIGKLLCQGNPLYRAAVLAAAEPHLFRPNASRVLFWEL